MYLGAYSFIYEYIKQMSVVERESIQIIIKKMMKRMKGKKKNIQIQYNTMQFSQGDVMKQKKKGTKQMQIIGHDWTQQLQRQDGLAKTQLYSLLDDGIFMIKQM